MFGCAAWIAVVILRTKDPLTQPDADVRNWLLTLTPVGTKAETVKALLVKKGWNIDGYQSTNPPPATKPFFGGDIGGYQGTPWYVFVSAFWEFDSDSRLTDIRVRRIEDSP
jgi:hypothetical protein